MAALFSLAFKKQPWRFHQLSFILILCILSISILGGALSVFSGSLIASPVKIQTQRESVTRNFKNQIKYAQQAPASTANAKAVASDKKIFRAIKQQHYLMANQEMLAAFQHNLSSATDNLAFDLNDELLPLPLDNEITKAKLTYLTQHKLNLLNQIDQYSSKVVLLLASLQLTSSNSSGLAPLLISVLLIIAITAFSLTFFADEMHKTKDLMRVSPANSLQHFITKSFTTLACLDSIILLAFAITVGLLLLIPGYTSGSLLYPISCNIAGTIHIIPAWEAFLLFAGILNLWLIVLASAAFFCAQLFKNNLAAILVMGAFTFADKLQLLMLFPEKMRVFFPAYYLNFGNMIIHRNQYATLSLTFVGNTFVTWTLFFIAGAFGMMGIKRFIGKFI